MLAKAFSQLLSSCQIHRVRQQAGSYRICAPVETTVADAIADRAHAPRGYAFHDASRLFPAEVPLTLAVLALLAECNLL